MADDIKQTLGFDASQALDVLKQLDQLFQTLDGHLTSTAAKLGDFNSSGGKAVTALNAIRDAANQAADAVNKVSSANFSGPKSGGASGLSGAAASDAFDQLLGGGAAKSKASKQAAEELITSMTQLQSQSAKTSQSFNQIGQGASSNFGKAQKGVANFTVSFETLVRVVTTQAIVRALSLFRDAVQEAISGAIQFQRSIARTQTIAPGESFDRIAKGVRSISDSFNIPLLETAEAVYTAVSNQVGDLGDSLQFTADAAVFAKATNSSLADSVNLLSGALKSFGLDSKDTNRVAGVFFTAIDKGRVTADELANTFGRVGPSAKNVGISMEEFAAGAAAISVKGTATNEALTQFRGIITSLTKPTDDMKKKLHELGFSTTEDAVATLRLSGLLEELRKSTGGSAQELAKLFPNIRGLGGELALTGDNLKFFADTVDEANAATSELIKNKAALVFATDAEKATKAVTQLKNALVADFGQAALHVAANFVEMSGGVETFVKAGETLVPLVVTIVGSLTAAITAIQATRLATTSLTGTLGPLALALSAVAVAPTIVSFFRQEALDQANSGIKALESTNAKVVASISKSFGELGTDFDKTVDRQVQAALRLTRENNKSYQKTVDDAKTSNKAIVADTERSLERIINTREKFAKAIEKAIVDSRQQVKDSLNRISDFKLQQQDLKFDGLLKGLNDAQQIAQLMKRSSDLANTAKNNFEKAFAAGDHQGEERARALFDKAQAELERAAQTASQTPGKADDRNVLKAQQDLLQRRIGLEEQINQKQFARQAALEQERRKQELIVEQLREQVKIAIENTGDFDKKGNQFSDKEQLDRAKSRQQALLNIAKLGLQDKDLTSAKALGLGDFIKNIQDDLRQKPINVTLDIERSIAQLQATLAQKRLQLNVELPFLKQLEKVSGKQLFGAAPEQINQELNAIGKEAKEIGTNLLNFNLSGEKKALLLGEVDKLIDEINARAAERSKGAASGGAAVRGQLQIFDQAVQKLTEFEQRLASGQKVSIEEFQALQKSLQAGTNAGFLRNGSLPEQFRVDIDKLGQFAGKIAALQESVEKGVNLPPDVQARFQELTSLLQQFDPTAPVKAFGAMSVQADSAAKSTNLMEQALSGSVTSTFEISTNLQKAALAAQQAAAALSAGKQQGRAFGGVMQGFAAGGMVNAMSYFDTGGAVGRGTDTINAMLGKGEFVVNSEQARRWFPQLQAINAGANPAFRESGGPVTNIGDINVNVTGGSSHESTGRSIARAIRREIRRGTSAL